MSMVEEIKPASPFLPGTYIQYAWDSTSLGWFKTCPRLYYYHMIEGWSSNDESVHLRFGIEYHQALQDYDVTRFQDIPHEDALHDVVRELLTRTFGWKSEHKYKNRNNLLRAVIWYLDKFKDDPAKTFTRDDGTPAVEVSFRFELDWGPMDQQPVWKVREEMFEGEIDLRPGAVNMVSKAGNPISMTAASSQPYMLCGHLDRVVEFNDDLYVMDRKSTKSQPSSWYFSQFEPDNQMTLYTLASQVIFQTPIRGVIIDAAQIAIEFSRFQRGFTYRTKEQIEEWLGDLKYILAQAKDYAAEGYWPMNDKSCGSYRSEESESIGCPFRTACSKSPQVREQFLKSDFKKLSEEERWNPLKAR